MTKNEAMQQIRLLTSGTIAKIIGSPKYERIDAASCDWILAIADKPENAFEACENWMDVLHTINA